MTTILGIRDLARNIDKLTQFDYVEIEDKKTKEYKGLFLSPPFAKEFKEYLAQKTKNQKNDKLARLRTFAGKGRLDEKYNNLSSSQLRKARSLEKNDG